NSSTQPEQFQIALESSPWRVLPEDFQTPVLEVGEQYETLLAFEIGDGAQSTYSINIAPLSNLLSQIEMTKSVSIETDVNLSVQKTTAPILSNSLSVNLMVTNTGNYTDSFTINSSVNNGLASVSTIENSGDLGINESTTLQISLEVENNHAALVEVWAVSDRSQTEVGRIAIDHRYFEGYLPFVINDKN
ncbi:MAG: hypothetical protein AAGD96_35385, partial [Chloroflexota bacterium]